MTPASLIEKNMQTSPFQNIETAAVVFLIHGTRNPKAVEMIRRDMQALRQQYSKQIGLDSRWVQYCFLEFIEPKFEDSLRRFCEAGRTEIVILPLLLFPGAHLYNDLPEVTGKLGKDFPNVTFRAAGAIGVLEPEFSDILNKRLGEAQ